MVGVPEQVASPTREPDLDLGGSGSMQVCGLAGDQDALA